ncbi:MAG TPA: ABC transporter ATP-binding protein [Acidobacteriaceae bacterium]|jgi:lipopolysaccharide transport system ATP-binding protein
MSDAVISVTNLSKRYRISHQATGSRPNTLREVIALKTSKLFSRRTPANEEESEAASSEEFWALRDVSFEVKQGEVMGVIGRNGAGKSTLLKILSRITEPTEGRVKIKGRVASLLEVGTGFHPELTGRENVFLNGAILGMSKAEIRRKFDEIVAFAEVEKFLDTPVKRYSSGMYVRLAFSVAAHLEPEILIVDEVLAVGDAAFQKKCMAKLEDVRTSGRSIIFVSHQIATVQRLCNRGLLLNAGRVEIFGETSEALEQYLSGSKSDSDGNRLPGTADGDTRITSWKVVTDGTVSHASVSREVAEFHITIESKRRIPEAHFGFVIRGLSGELLVSANSMDDFQGTFEVAEGKTLLRVRTRLPLKTGRYQVDLALATLDNPLVDHWVAEPYLSILPCQNTILPPEWHGLVNEPVTFEVIA